MMSIRFRDETALAILWEIISRGNVPHTNSLSLGNDILGSVGSVVHQQQLKVLDVVDEESLVAGGGQETGLLVGSVADLNDSFHISTLFLGQFFEVKFHVPWAYGWYRGSVCGHGHRYPWAFSSWHRHDRTGHSGDG